jgi:hypothetical protein
MNRYLHIDICRPGAALGDGANEHRTVRTGTPVPGTTGTDSEPCNPADTVKPSPENKRCNGAAEGSQRKQQRRKRNIWSVQSDTQPRHRFRPAVKA